MSTTDLGRLGEAKVMASLVEQEWYPYVDISGKSPIDILAWKDGRTISIQVKTTETRANADGWIVQLGASRPNRTGNVVYKFDHNRSDYLAVYIKPLDKVCFIPTDKFSGGRAITLRESDGYRAVHLINNYLLIAAPVAK